MLRQEIPPWVLFGGFLLTALAGSVNAIGLVGLHHQAFSHMSGAMTSVGIDLADGNYAQLRHAGGALASFFVGCMLSGWLLRQSTLRLGRRYGGVLALESALLFGAVYFLRQGQLTGDSLAAMAMGLQNAMATSYSGTLIRTTHVTGMVTDLGLALGHVLRGQSVDRRRCGLLLVLVAGFTTGAIAGAAAFSRFGYDALLFPATCTGGAGLLYASFKHFERLQLDRARRSARRELPGTDPLPVRAASGLPPARPHR